MRKLYTLLPLLVLLGCAMTADDHVAEGVRHAREKKFNLARGCFLDAIKVEPRNSTAYYQLGLVEYKQGKMRPAANHFSRTAELMETGGGSTNTYIEVLALLTKANAKKALPFWERHLLRLRSAHIKGREVAETKKIIQRIKSGSDPFDRSAQTLERAEWKTMAVPPVEAVDLAGVIRAALKNGKLPANAMRPVFMKPYGGALFATFFTKRRKRLTITGSGRTMHEALRAMLARASAGVKRNHASPCVISWITKTRGPETAAALGLDFEAGLDGLAPANAAFKFAALPEKCLWDGTASPSLVMTAGVYVEAIMDNMPNRDVEKTRFMRFRVRSFLQTGPDDAPVELFRGHGPAIEPTRENIRASLLLAGRYLAENQKADGLFPYIHHARKGYEQKKRELLIRQAGAAWSLCVLGKKLDRNDFIKAGRRTAAFFVKEVIRSEKNNFSFLVERMDYGATLGLASITALLFLEARTPGTEEYEKEIADLGRFMLAMQRKDGSFKTHYAYKPEEDIPRPHNRYYPQEAAFSLAVLGRRLKNKRYLDAAEKGARFLLKEKADESSESANRVDHWLVLACRELMENGVKDLDLTGPDRIIEKVMKLQRKDGPWDFRGSVDTHAVPRGPLGGSLAEAFTAWKRVLEMRKKNTSRTRLFLKNLAAFTLLNQVREIDAYYMKKPAGAVGGIRKSLLDDEIRVDAVQHVISGLLGVLESMK